MTVASTVRSAGPFTGNGVTTSFPFTFKVVDKTDLQVTFTDAAGVQSVLELDSDYSVILNSDQETSPGGSIEYAPGGIPLATGETLAAISNIEYTQGTSIANAGSFLPKVIEDALDRGVMLTQQVDEKANRSIHFPVGDQADSVLPGAAARAGAAIVFDDDGNAAVSGNIGALATSASSSASRAETARAAIDNRIYPGTFAMPPSTRPDGSPTQEGDEYFGTDGYTYVFLNGAWVNQTADAAASADAAAVDEASAAASAASAQAFANSVAQKVTFTTVALGHAGSADGQTFPVIQSNGEGVDIYLHSGASDIWQYAGAVGELAMAEVVERIQPETYLPVASMLSWQTLVQNGRGALNSARPKSRVFGRNMYGYVYGPRTQVSTNITVTPFFANGPTQTGTATRALLTTTAGLFVVWSSAYRPPSGTYTVDFQVKSNTGGDFAIRTGNASDGWTARTAAAAGWLRVQQAVVTNGTNWASFSITGDGTNTPDLLIDEMRIYEDVAANVPAIASDPQGDDFMPVLAVRKTRHSGRLLDNTAAAAEGAGVLRVQGYPTAKVFSEITLIAAASLTTAATSQQLLTTDTTTALGTTSTTLAITSSQADGAPDFSGLTSFFDYEMTGQGVVVLAYTVKNLAREGYLNGMELANALSAFAGFSARMFRVGANSTLELGYVGTFRWQGQIGAAKVFDRYLTADEIAVEVAKVQAGLRAAGIPLAVIPAIVIAIGDSQTSSTSGARGPSWAYLQADAGAFVPNMPVRVVAVGGTTTQDAVRDQLPAALRTVQQALAQNVRPVVSIDTSTNNQQEIVDDWNGGVSSFTSSTGWWQYTKTNLIAPIVAAGGKVTFATPRPDGGTPPTNWEPARVALQAKIIADYAGSTDVFVMDFGGTAGLSTVADTAGGNYDTDHRHVSSAGHLLEKPVATAAINAAMDAA